MVLHVTYLDDFCVELLYCHSDDDGSMNVSGHL